MAYQLDSAEVTGVITTAAGTVAGLLAPHPLQVMGWLIAIFVGAGTLIRLYFNEKRAREKHKKYMGTEVNPSHPYFAEEEE